MNAIAKIADPRPDLIRVLHVDDDAAFTALSSEVLGRIDDRFLIDSATRVDEALAMLEDGTFDCVVSDYDMPGRNGVEFLEVVRARHADLPFILFTGKGSESVASEAISAGVTDYLQKERGLDQFAILANRVTNAIDHHHSSRIVRRSERGLRRIVDALPHLLFVADGHGTLRMVNQPLAALFGVPVDELEGTKLAALVGDDLARPLLADIQAVIESEEGRCLDRLEVEAADGHIHLLEPRLEPYDTEDATGAVLGIAIDVTEDDRRARNHERTRERMELALEATGSIIFELDLQTGDVVRYGDLEGNLHLVAEEVPTLADYLERAIHPDDRDAVREHFERLQSGDLEAVTLRYRTMPAEGVVRWVSANVTVRHDERGEPRWAVGIARDVTEAERHERELAETRERFRKILAYSSDFVMIVDEDQTVSYVSPSVEHVMGYTPAEIHGTDAMAFSHPDDLEDAMAAFGGLLTEPEAEARLEERSRTADGEWRWVEVRGRNYLDDPHIGGLLVNVRDIDERKRRETELARQNDRLEQFASVVSHDLRNPLNVATGRLSMAREAADTDDLAAVDGALDRMAALIDDLLVLARQGRHVGQRATVTLGTVAERCWRNVETADASLVVEADVDISADRSRLQQLLENLMRNAVEHAGPSAMVTIGALEDGFFVEDDGPGIPSAERADVFEPGYTTSDTGTGFGLAIVREIAEAHGWTVAATEGRTGGARFEFTGIDAVR
ncbi:MAG: PAS domain S-box protein [Halobacteriales archaeon]